MNTALKSASEVDHRRRNAPHCQALRRSGWCVLTSVILFACAAILYSGCTSGGAAQIGINLSSGAAAVIDNGQGIIITATLTNDTSGKGVTWSLSGPGMLSNQTPTSVTYNAPAPAIANQGKNPTAATTATTTATVTATAAAVTTNPPTKSTTITLTSPPSLQSQTLTAAQIGTTYSQTITETGGAGTLTFAVTSGTLPAGLSLASGTGVVSSGANGPTGPAGSTTVTVKVTDSSQGTSGLQSSSGTVTIQVNNPPAPVVPAISAQSTTEFTAYNQQITQTTNGALGPFTWVVTGLPNGLSTNNSTTGTITIQGQATGPAGMSTVNVSVKDSGNPQQTSNTVQFTITVNEPPAPAVPAITAQTTTEFTTYGPQMITQTTAGAHGPFKWTVTGLPAGIQSDNSTTGTITLSGSAIGPSGTSTVMVSVQDSANPPQTSNTVQFNLTVNEPTAPSISPMTLPNGQVGTAYSQGQLTVSGGHGPFTFSVSAGTLPAGMNLSPLTPTPNPTATIGGTPTTPQNNVSFTIKVVDSSNPPQNGSQAYNININPPPAPAITTTQAQVPSGTVNFPFPTFKFQATGYTANGPLVFAATPPLTDNLTLNADGSVTGTPNSVTTLNFSVTATDTFGQMSTAVPFSITISSISIAFTAQGTPPSSLNEAATFTVNANVSNDPTNGGVDYSLNCGSAGACGGFGTPPAPTAHTASGTGVLYTAPNAVPTGNTVTIIAQAHAQPSVQTSGTVTITVPPIMIAFGSGQAPPNSMNTGTTVNLSANVTNDPGNGGVDYSVTCGSPGACGGFGSPPAATVNAASGAVVVYVAPNAVPTGNTVTIKAAAHDNPSQSVSGVVTITQVATCPQNARFCGDQAFFFYGYQGPNGSATLFTMIGRFHANADGTISATNAVADINNSNGGHQQVQLTNASYTLDNGDPNGTLTFMFNGVQRTYAITQAGTNVDFIEFDTATPLITGSGQIRPQDLTAVPNLLPSDFAFGFSGITQVPAPGRLALIGRYHSDVKGVFSGGAATVSVSGTTFSGAITGNITPDATVAQTGRLTAATSIASPLGPLVSNSVSYVVNINSLFTMSTDSPSSNPQVAGTISKQTSSGTFGTGSLSNGLVFNLSGQDQNSTTTPGTLTILGVTTAGVSGNSISLNPGEFDQVEADNGATITHATFTGTATAPDATTGKGTITLNVTGDNSAKPFTYFLISQNNAYLMEGTDGNTAPPAGVDVEFGLVEPQVSPFHLVNGQRITLNSITPAVNSNHNLSGFYWHEPTGNPGCSITINEEKPDGSMTSGTQQCMDSGPDANGRFTVTTAERAEEPCPATL